MFATLYLTNMTSHTFLDVTFSLNVNDDVELPFFVTNDI